MSEQDYKHSDVMEFLSNINCFAIDTLSAKIDVWSDNAKNSLKLSNV